MYIHLYEIIHDGASDPWTAAVSSLLALISREYAEKVYIRVAADFIFFLPNGFAQDFSQWELPDGAAQPV